MTSREKDHISHSQRVKSFHDQDAGQYRRLRYHSDSCEGLSYLTRRELVLGSLNHRPASILDVGCGPGILTEDLINKKYKVYSADLSIEMIKRAKESVGSNPLNVNASFAVCEATSLAFSKNRMDIVLCVGVISYVHDYHPVLAEIRRVLKPGGNAIIQINKIRFPVLYGKMVPLYHFLKSKLTAKEYGSIDFELNYFDYRRFTHDIEAEGFKIISVDYFDFRIPFLDILLPALSVKIGKLMFSNRHRRLLKYLAHGIVIRTVKTCRAAQ